MRIDGVIPREDFEWLADTVKLYGWQRGCLYLRLVEGMDAAEIAEARDLTLEQVQAALEEAEAMLTGHQWPETERGQRREKLRMLLEVIAGPAPSSPHTPHHARNEYTGELQQVQIRGKRVTVDDLM